MQPLSSGQFATILSGRLFGPCEEAAPLGSAACVTIDSRRVTPGDVFWALPGERRDGADFAGDAFARGAAGMVSTRAIAPPEGRWAIQVADAQAALWQLAEWNRRRFEGTVVAVTGSVGKTSTRGMIDTVLAREKTGCASEGNYNNHLGVPLSLLKLDDRCDYGVFELGASAAGEIGRLARLCRPHVGVVTCIGEAHLAGFGSVEAVAEAKAELLAQLPDDGTAVLCGDDPWLRRLAGRAKARCIWFGRDADCDVTASEVICSGGRLRFRVEGHEFTVPVWGRHNLGAALAAIAVGRVVGLSYDTMVEALAERSWLPAMRCEIDRIGDVTVINDAYNANPTSVRAALELLREFETDGRRIAVLGEMQELGHTADELHARVGHEAVTTCGADVLVACGNHADVVVSAARDSGMPAGASFACASTDDVVDRLAETVKPGDVLLVKGSRAAAMERVVTGLAALWPASPSGFPGHGKDGDDLPYRIEAITPLTTQDS